MSVNQPSVSSNPIWGAKFLPLRVHPHFRLTASRHISTEMASIWGCGSSIWGCGSREGEGRRQRNERNRLTGVPGGPVSHSLRRGVHVWLHNGQSLNFVVSAKHISELLSRRQPIALSEMLEQTKVSDRIGSSTIMVPAHNAIQLPFIVNGQPGGTLEGTYSITGGTGNDVGVVLLGPNNAVIVNSGRVTRNGEFRLRLPRGRYTLLFDNRFSNFSAKSVTPDLTVTYYK